MFNWIELPFEYIYSYCVMKNRAQSIDIGFRVRTKKHVAHINLFDIVEIVKHPMENISEQFEYMLTQTHNIPILLE